MPRCILPFFLGLAALVVAPSSPAQTSPPRQSSATDFALCPLVYQLDQSPGSHGYRYTFFGNAFFVNDQGYLLTVAHVLETFRDGGQPYILVSRPNSPPRMIQVTVVATDTAHDVAVLRATPNPFGSNYQVAFLPLATGPAIRGQSVVAISLHPGKPQNARTFDLPREDRSEGEVLSYESTHLEKSGPATDVILLSHPVTLGQSGSPVISADSHAVLGLIEGRWLRTSAIAPTTSAGQSVTTPGAAVPVGPAIILLDQNHIPWHAAR